MLPGLQHRWKTVLHREDDEEPYDHSLTPPQRPPLQRLQVHTQLEARGDVTRKRVEHWASGTPTRHRRVHVLQLQCDSVRHSTIILPQVPIERT
ncbi:hypothetical protein MGN70_003371 [Eutypa lata]|nr:hypothetical protein MGN70_003371 [Eutypa lata]